MVEALIRLRPESGAGIAGVEHVILKIEEAGGRALLSHPPFAIVALLPEAALQALRDEPLIYRIDTDEIAEDAVGDAPEALRIAIAAWNEHVRSQAAPKEHPLRDLPWDAPGMLPPDRPRPKRPRDPKR